MINLSVARERLNKVVDLIEILDNANLINRTLFDYSYSYFSEVLHREDIGGNFCIEYIIPRSLNLLAMYNNNKEGKFSDYIDRLINMVLNITDGAWK